MLQLAEILNKRDFFQRFIMEIDLCHCFENKPEDALDDAMNRLDSPLTADFVRSVMACKSVPGMAVAVVSKGVRWTKGFGVKDVDTETPVDEKTLFGIGSLTKAFTSALLALALQDANQKGRRLTWQSKVAAILRDDDLHLAGGLEVNLTLADILTHRTGLMSADLMAVAGFPPRMTRARFIRELRHLKATGEFGEFMYNNWMYSLAGDVSERLLGGPWKDVIKQNLLSPLAMDDTLVVWDDVNVTSPVMAKPYYKIEGSLTPLDNSLFDIRQGKASGSLAVSADDMSKWMDFLLGDGVPRGSDDRLLRQSLMTDMMTSHLPLESFSRDDVPVGDTVEGVGYGWFLGTYRKKKTVFHTGGWFGYISTVTLYPDDDTAVFVSTNGPGTSQASDAMRAITYHLADLALGHSPWLNQTTACSAKLFGTLAGKEEKRGEEEKVVHGSEEAKRDAIETENDVQTSDVKREEEKEEGVIKNLKNYVGTFSNPLFGEVVIGTSPDGRGLTMRLQTLEGVLRPGWSEMVFHVLYTGKTEFYSRDNFDVKLSTMYFGWNSAVMEGIYTRILLRGPAPDTEFLEFIRKD